MYDVATVFIFHGISGHPGENWFPWLKEQLELRGHWVILPSFPNADEPDLDAWLMHMDQYRDSIDGSTVFVGHSLGGSFAMHLLETLKAPIRATALVASVSGPTGSKFDPRMTTFTETPYDWDVVKKNAGAIDLFHTDNDPYIPVTQAETLAKNLGVPVTLIPGGGHLNATVGFMEFPLLLETIETRL